MNAIILERYQTIYGRGFKLYKRGHLYEVEEIKQGDGLNKYIIIEVDNNGFVIGDGAKNGRLYGHSLEEIEKQI